MSIDKINGPAPCLEEHSTCEACGSPFDCGATLAGCWCTQLKLTEQLLSTLRARYRACLCRSCLERLVEAEQEEQQQERPQHEKA